MAKPQALIVAERRARLRAEGLCIACGQRPATVGPRGGRLHCDQCREVQNRSSQSWQRRHPESLKTTEAKQRRSEWDSSKRAELLAAGICTGCRKSPATVGPKGSKELCDACRQKQQERSRRRWAEHKASES